MSRVAPCPSGSCLQGVPLFQLRKRTCGGPLDTDPKEQHLLVIHQEIFLLPQLWPKTGFCVSTTCLLQAASQSPGLLFPWHGAGIAGGKSVHLG